ncbi:hypothetical protein [Xenorhabdus lircayensis]|uniref:Uncharacterized protein n=1 Tax=Xenorhabdus lircayensis TaxID=2763499 RepID=A0ABS0U7R7_9GAMM|nr:hypothetical protein [Xenorhabdus lircayensis]MBI6549927.1 hypothetical protein [Xenorhabdus lircayensis]
MKVMNMISGTILVSLYFLLAAPALAEEKNVNAEKQPVLSAEYNMELKNSSLSQEKLTIIKKSTECMYDSGADQINIGPNEHASIYLKDNDNLFSGCTLSTKRVEWKISSGPMSCDLSFEHGYDAGWYTEIKGCQNIVNSAICAKSDCNQTRVYGGESEIDISVELLVK